MQLVRTEAGTVVEHQGRAFIMPLAWDAIFRAPDVEALALQHWERAHSSGAATASWERPLAPVEGQEVWAAGVTYYRSRDARMEESSSAAGGDFYARVYEAERPELFFKSTAHRAVGHGGSVRLRADSQWNVPEPELVLAVNSQGRIFGYTVGNDMSSRDIEGQNPLYLAQAKVYDGSCALGPSIVLANAPLPPETTIALSITRQDRSQFKGSTTLAQMKRSPVELADYLFRDQSFPSGVLLMTGTGIIPPSDFTLHPGDQIEIEIDGVGRLLNTVSQ
ncbi:MAG TPA: fumarylacetoacetate hydrolase family protein [Polyangiaceae bacterium]|nr:fumarylacetoacetate hydrolase family protein [Polyangiaceae bacterium]